MNLKINDINHILILRVDRRIGNILLITPFIRTLRHTFPNATIDALVCQKFATLLEHNPNINSVIEFNKLKLLNPLYSIKLLSALRGRQYDLLFDLSHPHNFSKTHTFLSRIGRSKHKVGFTPAGHTSPYELGIIPSEAILNNRLHESASFLKLIEPLTDATKIALPPPQLTVPSEYISSATKTLRDTGVYQNGIIIGIHIGGRRNKELGLDRGIELARKLIEYCNNLQVLIFYGPRETSKLKGLADEQSKLPENIKFIPPQALLTFAGLIQKCDIFISGDTGPMHMAVALNVPTIEVFFKDNQQRYGYQHLNNHLVIKGFDIDNILKGVTELR